MIKKSVKDFTAEGHICGGLGCESVKSELKRKNDDVCLRWKQEEEEGTCSLCVPVVLFVHAFCQPCPPSLAAC